LPKRLLRLWNFGKKKIANVAKPALSLRYPSIDRCASRRVHSECRAAALIKMDDSDARSPGTSLAKQQIVICRLAMLWVVGTALAAMTRRQRWLAPIVNRAFLRRRDAAMSARRARNAC